MFGFGRKKDKEREEAEANASPDLSESGKKPKKRGILYRLGWYADAAIILAVGFGGYTMLQILAPQPTISDAPDRTPFVEVITAEIKSGPVIVKGYGVVRSRAEIGLAAQVAGQVVFVSPDFKSGGEFRKDDILVQIDPRTYEANLTQAEANKKAGEASLAYAESQVNRNRELAKQGFTAKQRFDQLISLRDEAQANMARLEALVDQAKLNLEHATIIAPFDGRVESENVDEGTYLSIGAEIGQIFATDAVEVSVPLSDEEASLLPNLWNGAADNTKKLKATLTASYGGERYQWTGYVDRAAANIDTGTRTLNVVVRVDDPFKVGKVVRRDSTSSSLTTPPPLLVGMYATVEMEGKELDRYVTLPREALRDNDTIWRVNADNELKIQPVSVVQKRGNEVTVVSDRIVADTRVIISALTVVVDGMKVRILDRTRDPQAVSQADMPIRSLMR